MNYRDVERLARSLPRTTLRHKFGPAPEFRVGGKLFLVITLDARGIPEGLGFKAGPESFQLLTKIKDITPCPSTTRAHWVALDGLWSLKSAELKSYIERAHAMITTGLPKKTQRTLGIRAAAKENC